MATREPDDDDLVDVAELRVVQRLGLVAPSATVRRGDLLDALEDDLDWAEKAPAAPPPEPARRRRPARKAPRSRRA